MLSSPSLHAVRTFWSVDLGAESFALDAPGVTYVIDDSSDDATVVEVRGAVVVTAPTEPLDLVRAIPSERLTALDALADAVGPWLAKPLGVNRLFYADAPMLTPAPNDGPQAVELAPTDPRVAALKASCTPEEWEVATLDEPFDQLFGVVHDDAVVAVAGYETWDDLLAQIAVLTAPAHRERGLAGVVGRAAARAAITHGLVAQWRVRPENTRSTAVATRLGFECVGVLLAVGLRPTLDA